MSLHAEVTSSNKPQCIFKEEGILKQPAHFWCTLCRTPTLSNPLLNENICHGNIDLQRANDVSERLEYFLSEIADVRPVNTLAPLFNNFYL